MKKLFPVVLVACGLIGLSCAGMAMANSAVDGDEPAMMVSPSVIVLAKVSTVTVHTNIPASAVEADSIELDGAAWTSVGVDSLGHLVAKFEVAALDLKPGEAILTLSGDFKDGVGFIATDAVSVK